MNETASKLEDIIKRIGSQSLPPVHKWTPDFCGKIDIRIKSDGSWDYMGTPITRQRLVRLFSTVLRKDDDVYYLVTPVEKLEITVDDAPFFATSVKQIEDKNGPALLFETNIGEEVVADVDHPIYVTTNGKTGEPRPYIHVRGGMSALIARPVFYELIDLAHEGGKDGNELILSSCGSEFSLGQF